MTDRNFYAILIMFILASVGITFIKYVIYKDYQIVAETSCDPVIQKCFTRDDGSYYKMVSKKAATILACEATKEKLGCDTELNCTQGEAFCSYTYNVE